MCKESKYNKVAFDGDELWVSRDGRETPVGTMDESYAKNALRKLLKTLRERREAMSAVEMVQLEEDCCDDDCCDEACGDCSCDDDDCQ